MGTGAIFLTAEWRHLVLVNYAIDPQILRPRVPRGTELDPWNGVHYVSLVGFNFLHTRVRGTAIPYHSDFEEINLRFYVRRKDGPEWKRGVVFVKEVVPKPAIALAAKLLYNENYVALPTRHSIEHSADVRVRYEWKFQGRWHSVEAVGRGNAQSLREGSEAQFICEHYWGYSVQRKGGTKEYRVEHPSWNVWPSTETAVDVDAASLYGAEFGPVLDHTPASVFIADGSEVTVSKGRRLQPGT